MGDNSNFSVLSPTVQDDGADWTMTRSRIKPTPATIWSQSHSVRTRLQNGPIGVSSGGSDRGLHRCTR